jgi:hypothetical protein
LVCGRFWWDLVGYNVFWSVSGAFWWVLVRSAGFWWVLVRFSVFLLGSIGFCWVLVGYAWFWQLLVVLYVLVFSGGFLVAFGGFFWLVVTVSVGFWCVPVVSGGS